MRPGRVPARRRRPCRMPSPGPGVSCFWKSFPFYARLPPLAAKFDCGHAVPLRRSDAPMGAGAYNRPTTRASPIVAMLPKEECAMDTPAPFPDADPQETREWLDALDGVIKAEGPDRAHFLLEPLIDQARRAGANLPFSATTAYINTIPVEQQVKLPGDAAIEERIRSTSAGTRWRWCCRRTSTPTSAATSPASPRRRRSTTSASTTSGTRRRTSHGGDLVFVQGHSAPGIYARALPGGPPHRGAARQLPPGSRRQGPLVLSAPVADARLLAVPDGVDGPRAR